MLWNKSRKIGRRRPLLLQSLEERILWDATLAPEPESLDADAEVQEAAQEIPETESVENDGLSENESVLEEVPSSNDEQAEDVSEATDVEGGVDANNVDGSSEKTASATGSQEAEELGIDITASVTDSEFSDEDNSSSLTSVSSALEAQTGLPDSAGLSADISDSQSNQIIIVDTRIDEAEELVADILANHSISGDDQPTIIYLNQDQSGIDQITDVLRAVGEVETLHIVSHGDDALLYLGNEEIDANNLSDASDTLKGWSDYFTQDADILLYGCDIAQSSEGQAFVADLAMLTGTDVAASDDTTGSVTHNANWNLEFSVGKIEARSVLSSDGNWTGQLGSEVAEGTVSSSADAMIDEDPSITLTFDNTGADTGFAPFGDFVVDPGVDVAGMSYLGAPVVDFTTVATWNAGAGQWESPPGSALTTHPFEGDAGGAGGLPLPDGAGFQDGATWYSFKLPFGSFVAAQPAATIDVDATFNDDAVVGQPINMSYTPGFLLGCDENGADDPHVGATTASTTTPSVIQIVKRNDLPELETPTGPNYPVGFTITVNIAEGETIDNLVVEDYLPSNANFIGTATDVMVTGINDATVTAGTTVTFDNPGDPGQITVDMGTVTGTQVGAGEIEITYFVWFEDIVTDGVEPTTNSVLSLNESSVTGDYDGTQVSDNGDSDVAGPDGSLDDGDLQTEAQNITTQKTVQSVTGFNPDGSPILGPTTTLNPGDILYWTVEVQVSDYHAFDNVVFEDILSDGQQFLNVGDSATSSAGTLVNAAPMITVNNDTDFGGNTDDSALGTVTFGAANIATTTNADGTETTVFNVSDQLVAAGGDGVLVGDLNASQNGVNEAAGETETTVPNPPRLGAGATTVTLTYYSQIQESYSTGNPDLQGNIGINAGDPISNEGTISGDVGDVTDDNGTFTPLTDAGGNPVNLEDDTGVELEISPPTIQKYIYAVNGVEVQSPNVDEDDNESGEAIVSGIQPGDVITYRLRIELTSANGENLVISDFLPLPVYDAGGEFAVDPVFANSLPVGSAPGAAQVQSDLAGASGGTVLYGEDYNLHTVGADFNIVIPPDGVTAGAHPTDGTYADVTLDAASNALFFDFGTFEEVDTPPAGTPTPVVLDLLLNVTVQDVDFSDGLLLTNQTQVSQTDSFGEVFLDEAIVQIGYVAPALTLAKGVVAVSGDSNGSSSPAAPTYGLNYRNTDPGAGAAAGDSISFDADGVTLDDLAGGLGVLDGDAEDVDGADWVRYALTVQNNGQGDAQDILIADSLPQQAAGADGFVLPADSTDSAALISALNLQVFQGNGVRVADGDLEVSVVGGVLMVEIAAEIDGRTLDTNGNEIADSDEILNDPNPGVDAQSEVTNVVDGDEVLIITYDLQLDNEITDDAGVVIAGDEFSNTATIEEYYQTAEDDPARNDENNRALLDDPADLTDDAMVSIAAPSIAKNRLGTELDTPNNDSDNAVVVGERVTYEVRITVPEGQTLNAVLNDRLDRGLELVSIDSISVVDQNGNANPGAITSSIWGADFNGFTQQSNDANPNLDYTFRDNGRSSIELSLGDLVNTNTDNTIDEVIVIEYTVMVTNDSINQQGVNRNNVAQLSFDDSNGDSQDSNRSRARNVTILEPLLEVVKTVNLDGDPSTGNANDEVNPDSVTGDEGDLATYTIVIQHTGDSDTDAYDVNFDDVLPPQLVNVNLVDAIYSLDSSDLVANGNIVQSGSALSTANDFTLELGETITITVTAEIGNGVSAGDIIDNTAEIDWTSYPESPAGTDFVPAGQEDVERGGGDNAPAGGEDNDYSDADPSRIIIGSNEIEKFLVNSEITDEADATADGQLAVVDDTDGINRGAEATIGETLTYQVVITLAEGTTAGASILDSLDPGLALVSIDNIFTQQVDSATGAVTNVSSVPNLTVAGLGAGQSLGAPVTSPGGIVSYTVDGGTGGGDLISIALGDIDNANSNDDILEQIVIQYTVMVSDEGSNISGGVGTPGTELNNSAEMTWSNTLGEVQTTGLDSADEIEVVEPNLEVLKGVSVDGPGDAGDMVTYTITIQHTGESEADAFDVSLYDELPDQVDFTAVDFGAGTNITIVDSAGILGTSDLEINTLAGSNGALQFAATGNTSVDTTVTGSSQNTIDLPLTPDPRVITITITGVLADTVEPGDIISNEAQINYSSLDEHNDGAPDGDNEDNRSDFVHDGSQGERDYSDTDPADDIAVPVPSIAKELVGSDVDSASNAENQATIGEIVTYRITIDVPEGSMDNAQIVDNLTPGLEFVDISSITGTANGSSVASTSAGVNLEDATTIATSFTGAASTGQAITFDFGDILATGDNAGGLTMVDQGLDQIIIEYRVAVVDIPANFDGAPDLDNSATFTFDTTNEAGETVEQSTATVDADDIEIIEPELQIVKTVDGEADGDPSGPLDAGDTVTYTFVISHTGDSSTDAHDVNFSDVIPPELINVALFSAVSSLGAGSDLAAGDIAITPAGDAVETVNPFTIQLDETVTIIVTGEIAVSIGPGETIVNTGTIEWSSLPPGHENDGLGNERGDPTDPDDVYSDDDPAEFFTDVPEFSKGVISSSIHGDGGDGEIDLTIGEQVTFELVVTLPEGTTNVLVTDNLPPLVALAPFTGDTDGVLEVVGATVAFVGAGINSSSTGLAQGDTETSPNISVNDVSGDGFDDQVIFDFGAVEVDGNNTTAGDDNVIRIQVTAVVKNLPGSGGAVNEDGDELTNEATLNFADDPDNPGVGEVLLDDATVDIIEPELEIDKEFIDPATGNPIIGTVTPGDTVRVRMVVTNTGTANAYDVAVSDPYNAVQPVFENPVAATTPTGFSFSTDAGGAGLGDDSATFTADPTVFIAPLQTLTFEFDVVVTESEIGVGNLEGLTVANTATVTGDSLDGDNPDERDTEDEDTDVLFGDPDLEKTVIDTSTSVADTGNGQFDDTLVDLTIGETVTYQLVVTLPETDINNNGINEMSEQVSTILTDNLPENLDLISAQVVSVGSDITMSNFAGGEVLGDTNISGTVGDASVTFNIGNITVIDTGDDGNLADQQIVINVTAIVKNDPVNSADDDKINVATLTYGAEEFEDTATVEVVEPELGIVKNFVDAITGAPVFAAEPGELVQINLFVENTGSAHAYDVTVTDDLTTNIPAFFDSGTATLVAGTGFTFDATGDVVTFSGGTLAPNQSATLSFTVMINSALVLDAGQFIDNTADIVGDTLPPGDPNEDEQRVSTAEDTDSLTTPGITKDVVSSSHDGTGDSEFVATNTDLTIGEVVTYEVTISIPNTADNADVTLVGTSILDTLPAGFALVDARVTSIGGNTTAGATSGGEFLDSSSPLANTGPASTFLAVGDSIVGGSANIAGTVGGSAVTFNFGGLAINDADSAVGAEQEIVVQIDAVVLDDSVNNPEGAQRTNTASLLWEEIPGDPVALSDTVIVDIVAPDLMIEKAFIDPISGDDAYIVEAGDSVIVMLEVTNDGSANAYDVLVEDEIDLTNWSIIGPVITPPGFIYSLEDGANPVSSDTVTFTMTSSGDAANPDNFVAPNETVAFTFELMYTGAADLAEQITNTAEVTGDSLPDDEVVMIPGLDTERETNDSGTDVLYEGPDLVKSIFNTSVGDTGSSQFDALEDVTIGEEVIYDLLITLPQTDMNGDGALDAMEVVSTTLTDSLPANLALVDAEVITIGADIVSSDLGVGNSLVLGSAGITGPAGGLSATFNFGDVGVLDQNGNGDLTEQQVLVRVTAIVTNDPVNAQEDAADSTSNDKENVATLNFGDEVIEDNAIVEIVEPILEITKNFVDPNTGTPIFAAEAGETVQIELILENTGSAHAYDVVATDDLNANVASGFIDSGSAVLVSGPGFTFGTTGDVVTFSNGTIPPDTTVTLRFNVTLSAGLSLVPNEVIENTADVLGDSLPPGDPNSGEQRETTDMDSDELYGLPAITKEVADNYDGVPPGDDDLEATSHGATDDSQFDPNTTDLTIGEVVTYEITIIIPNTFDDPNLTTISTSITDTLPVGMALVDARLVAIGGNTNVGDIEGGEFVSDANANVTGGPASSGLAIGDSLVDGSADITGAIGGNTVTFDFGGLAVDSRIVDEGAADDLVGEEQSIVVQIDAIVLDDPSNFAGELKQNIAQLVWEETQGDPILISDTAEVEIVEPELTIAKSFIDPTTGADVYTVGTGDQVVVVLEVTNNGTANAYDTIIEDEIDLDNWTIIGEQITPPGLVYSIENGLDPVASDTVTYTMTSSGGATNPDNFIAPGETIRVEFILAYTGADESGAQIDNTATVAADSLPDDEVVNIPGLDTERETSDDDSDFVYEDPGLSKVVVEGLNPDTGSDQHAPTLVDLNVGEQVTYELTITLPESVLDATGNPIPVDVNLIDDLPDGFAVVNAEVTAIGSAVIASDLSVGSTLSVLDPSTLDTAIPSPTDDSDINAADVNLADGFGDQIVFSFGDVTVADVNDLSLQTITVRVTAVVMNLEPENTDGAVQTNEATLEFFGTPTGDPMNPFDSTTPIEVDDSADVEIVEPELEITKSFLNASGSGEVDTVTSGDTVTIQLAVTNTGTGPGYDLVINDPLDPSQFATGTVSPAVTPPGFIFSQTDDTVTYTLDSSVGNAGDPSLVILPGQTIIFTFTVEVNRNIGPETATNTATVDADSAPGDNPFDREEPTKEGTDTLGIRPVPIPPSSEVISFPGEVPVSDSETLAERVLRTYRYDVFDLIRDEFDELFERIRNDIQHELPKTPVHYMATGITEHGSNVTMIVYDESGAIIGYSSTLADSAGNWVFSFPQLNLDKSPHHVEVQVSPASTNESSVGEFNTRVYFTPASDAKAVHYKGLQVGDIVTERADSILDSMHSGNQNPFGSPDDDWNHPYEFLGSANIENI